MMIIVDFQMDTSLYWTHILQLSFVFIYYCKINFSSSSLFWTPYQLASKLCFYIKEASGAAGFIGFPQAIKEVACDIWEAQLSNGWSIGLILGAFGITRVSYSQSDSACIFVSMTEEFFIFLIILYIIMTSRLYNRSNQP